MVNIKISSLTDYAALILDKAPRIKDELDKLDQALLAANGNTYNDAGIAQAMEALENFAAFANSWHDEQLAHANGLNKLGDAYVDLMAVKS